VSPDGQWWGRGGSAPPVREAQQLPQAFLGEQEDGEEAEAPNAEKCFQEKWQGGGKGKIFAFHPKTSLGPLLNPENNQGGSPCAPGMDLGVLQPGSISPAPCKVRISPAHRRHKTRRGPLLKLRHHLPQESGWHMVPQGSPCDGEG